MRAPLPWPATLIVAAIALALPFMLGNRTMDAMSTSLLLLTSGAFLAALAALWPGRHALPGPDRAWLVFAGVFTALILLQVAPVPALAAAFGPYPEALWSHPEFAPRHWSPDVGATLRGWAAFVALFTVAWIAYSLPAGQRNVLWLLLAASAVFQAVYGIGAHAMGSDTILGIWERNNPGSVHGSFSNRNLFAAYLALLWPLAVAVWWIRDMPLLDRRSKEIKIAGSLITSAIIGAALLGSASRLGSTAGLLGMVIALVLWSRHWRVLRGAPVWPAYLALGAGLLAAAWYGLLPLAERLLQTGLHDGRFEIFGLMLTEFPLAWWVHGVGLGGFEAAFKQIQPGHIGQWWDYAHNDLLQWLVEMGVIGAALLVAVAIALIRAARPSTERIALYAGLAALALVSLADFSWHIPATQVVLAMYIGTLLRSAAGGGRRKGDGGIKT
ncbi:O-antigen ligase family protein [Thioalkalivibrio sp.]|uniref:O-antigen ligase family protein n=1 Tax=Thioalkalivibrio sp. TaxID=2093813 RepID=UPI003975E9A9